MKQEKAVENQRIAEADAVSRTLSSIYRGVFLINLMDDTYLIIKGTKSVESMLKTITSAQQALYLAIEKTVFEVDAAKMFSFVDLSTLSERMKQDNILNTEYRGMISGWVRGSFMEVERDSEKKVTQVLYTYQVIDEEKRKELDHLKELKNNYALSEKENRENRKRMDTLEEDKTFLTDTNTELQRARDAVQTILKFGSYLCVYAKDGETLLSIKFSDALRKLYGYSGTEDAPDTWEMWLEGAYPEDRRYVENCYNAALKDRTGNTNYDVTYRAVKKDGSVRWFRAAAYIIRRADGTAEFSYGFIMDIDKQKKAEDQVKEALQQAKIANEAKTSFLARMSHDIRTPMNGIMGLIEINERHADDIEFTSRNRKKAKVAAGHLLSLINDVLQLSKLEDQTVRLSYEPFDLQELSDEILTIIEQRAKEKEILVERQDDPSILDYPYVYGSPLHVKQIFINILGNSIKYNKVGGSVFCHAAMEKQEAGQVLFQVEIKDTGIGMSEEFLTHLFEPFTRERDGMESGREGTGLGMSIVKQLLDKMGGTIKVSSIPDIGSCFTVEIPFKIATKEVLAITEDENISKKIYGKHVLLAEDNALNMEIAEIFLTDAGVCVTKAINGQQAFEIFKDHRPGTFDAILMDVMMPVMNGYEATRQIRSMERKDAKEIPIIAITANAFQEDVESAINSGMNDHLSKPLNIQKMISVLAKYIAG